MVSLMVAQQVYPSNPREGLETEMAAEGFTTGTGQHIKKQQEKISEGSVDDSMDSGNEEGSTCKRRRQKGYTVRGGDMFPVDRISDLPESVISHILSLLPTKSAVATSFLSKNWRLRWTQIAAFDFDDQLWPNSESDQEMSFVDFVNLVFANHNESVQKLRLRWLSRNVRPVSLNMWLNAAIGRNIQHLDLAALPPSVDLTPQHSDEEYEFNLPAALYTSANLQDLKLRGPFRVKLPSVVCLPKLTLLELLYVKFECDESVQKLISACPVLHWMEIKMCHYHGDLLACKVSSHSLKSVKIYFEDACGSCLYPHDMKLVIDTPLLEYLALDSELEYLEIICVRPYMPVNEMEIYANCDSDQGGVAGLIKACDDVKVMKLWEPAMYSLGCGTTPLPATFGRLTKLAVEFTGPRLRSLLDLIDRCINLQVLDIVHVDVSEVISESPCGPYWRPPIRVPGCLSSSLKHVYIRLFEGLEDEMALLSFILDHGLVIETVTLTSNHSLRSPCSSTEKFNIVNKVLMLNKASSTCTISFS